jgi:hypothetical protein
VYSENVDELMEALESMPDASRLKIELAEKNGDKPVISFYSQAIEGCHRFQGLTVDVAVCALTELLSDYGICVARSEYGRDPKKHAETSLNFETPYSVKLYCVKQGRPKCYEIADAITETCKTLEDV